MYTLREFLSLVFALTFGLGFVFQLPLVVAPLIRFGLLKPDFFKRKRRYVILGSVLIGALISPTGSPIDMLIAGAPVFLLVEGGVLLGKLWKNSALKRAMREAKAAEARGEKVDLENIAGGLAVDLEEKLKNFAGGGARQLARDLLGTVKSFKEGVREAGGFDASSLFDDDFKDDEKPPAEVKLKTQPRKKREVAPATPAATVPEVKVPETAASQPPSAAEAAPVKRERDDFAAIPGAERIPADIALYVDNRIACRLDEMFEEKIKPFVERALKEARQNGNGHGTGA
ncbi:partial Sec-independent protein translocase protein TatC, partial [Gammaproteobacteria bacterium]